ncbi:MAG: hypothetical protein IT223_01145 [Crocinitomicaceae bacterium]|nr:hypothetical protein [Crocinitomicaceae bacterium]
MKLLFSLVAIVGFSFALKAQGTLQFNRVLKVTDTPTTVDVGKVWKVTSIYGYENACIMYSNSQSSTWSWKKILRTSYYVDGVEVISSLKDQIIKRFCNSSTCSVCDDGWTTAVFDASVPANPNILPMWLEAGTTLASGGSNTFLSVIEFNIVP